MAHNQSSFTLSKQERRDIKRLAEEAGLSFSNYVRRELGLELLKHGDEKRFKRKAAQPTEEK